MSDEKPFGFKSLTQDNWLKPDEIMQAFVRLNANGMYAPLNGDEYFKYIFESQLSKQIPKDVQALFEVAEELWCMGSFYPLYTLATEQLYRVAEAAVVAKCKILGLQKKNSFEQKIDWLAKKEVIQKNECAWWQALRHLRNTASHPEYQEILMPNEALWMLQNIVDKINELFEK